MTGTSGTVTVDGRTYSIHMNHNHQGIPYYEVSSNQSGDDFVYSPKMDNYAEQSSGLNPERAKKAIEEFKLKHL